MKPHSSPSPTSGRRRGLIAWVSIGSLLATLLGVLGAAPANAVGFSISGTITGAGSGALAGVFVCANPLAGGSGICATSIADGTYTLSGVPAASYFISFAPPEGSDFVGERWNNVPLGSTPTTLAVSGNLTGIDAELAVGTSISGVLLGGPSGVPLQGGAIFAYKTDNTFNTTVFSAADGSYRVPGLPAGDYKVSFTAPPMTAYAPEWWNDKATFQAATIVSVGTTPISGWSTTLAPAGGLSGNVKGVLGANLPNAGIGVYTRDGVFVNSATANSNGDWAIASLPAGTYAVQITGPYGAGYATEWLDDKSSRELSNPVTVSVGSTTAGLNAVLELAGSVTGNVTDTLGANIYPVAVRAVGLDGYLGEAVYTDTGGNYTLPGLKPGDYTVSFDPSSAVGGYAPQWWFGASNPASATYFAVGAGATASGRNAVLVGGSTISGRLTSATGAPLSGMVRVYRDNGSQPSDGNFARYGFASGDGIYSVSGLAVGTYRVGFTTTISADNLGGPLPTSDPYVSEWYSDKYTFSGSTTVTITSPGQSITGINGTLENPRFADVPDPSSAFYPYIEWMASTGISTGSPQPTGKPLYKPADAVSRQAMALFLYRLSGETFSPPATPTFADVTSSSHPQFYKAIEWMAARLISTGTPQPSGKPLYKPSDPVSRQAMALFLARYDGQNLSTPPTVQRFADVPLSASSAAAINWMFESGVSTGTPQPPGLPLYKPTDPVSRQAMAAFLFRVNALGP